MLNLEFWNTELEKKVKLKKIYNQMLALRRAKVLERKELPNLNGYIKTKPTSKELFLFELYFNEEKNSYALIEANTGKKIFGYVLDYSNEELVNSLVDKCDYLNSSYKVHETNGYRGLGIVIVILSIVGAFFGEGSGVFIVTIPGIIFSAIYFGIGRIIDELQEIRNKI